MYRVYIVPGRYLQQSQLSTLHGSAVGSTDLRTVVVSFIHTKPHKNTKDTQKRTSMNFGCCYGQIYVGLVVFGCQLYTRSKKMQMFSLDLKLGGNIGESGNADLFLF
jgi:hypothetical protein